MTSGPVEYLGAGELAEFFGVDSGTVDIWRRRYAHALPFPEPDVKIGRSRPIAGWHPDREQEIRDWHASRPGRGRRHDLSAG